MKLELSFPERMAQFRSDPVEPKLFGSEQLVKNFDKLQGGHNWANIKKVRKLNKQL